MESAKDAAAALDHLVYAVPHLEDGIAWLREKTGIEAARGGTHEGRGTHNALVTLRHAGPGPAYLELLAPDPAQPGVSAEDSMLGLGDLGADFVPHLYAWAVRPRDLDLTVQRARAAGTEVGEPVAASRRTPAGTDLRWRLAVPRPLGLGGVQPFLIDWGDGGHPTDDDLPCLDLADLRAVHPGPSQVLDVLTTLGSRLSVGPGEKPDLRATVVGPAGAARL